MCVKCSLSEHPWTHNQALSITGELIAPLILYILSSSLRPNGKETLACLSHLTVKSDRSSNLGQTSRVCTLGGRGQEGAVDPATAFGGSCSSGKAAESQKGF